MTARHDTPLIAIEHPNATREDFARAFDWVLVGGNSIASALVNEMGPDFCELTKDDLSEMFERKKSISYAVYEMWTCWKCMMEAREMIRLTSDKSDAKEGTQDG